MKRNIITLLTLFMGIELGLGLSSCATPQANQTPVSTTTTTTETVATPYSSVEERNNYNPINVNQLDPSVSLTGRDPQALALAAFGLNNIGEQEGVPAQETVTVNTDNPNQAIVTITQTGLADDSVRNRRYLVELQPVQVSGQSQWQIIWAGQQYICRSGRGPQTWTPQLCS